MPKAFLNQRSNGCDTLNPFCSRCYLHLQCVSDKLSSVVTRHTDRADISCFPCSPNHCQHHLNNIHIPCPELSCFTVTVFQNFRFECMLLFKVIPKVSKVAKIRKRYNQVPHLTQDTNGKVTNSQKTAQTRAKRSALSQQVTTKHTQTDAHKT